MLIELVRLLKRHNVEFMIVGGAGAVIQGASMSTRDLDIMPDPAPDNLQRLADALNELSPRPRLSAQEFDATTSVDSVLFRTNPITSFLTTAGPLDVLMELPNVGGFDAARPRARRYLLGDVEVLVADIDDLITSKQAADRGKDWAAMPALIEARDRLREAPDEYELDPAVLDPEENDET